LGCRFAPSAFLSRKPKDKGAIKSWSESNAHHIYAFPARATVAMWSSSRTTRLPLSLSIYVHISFSLWRELIATLSNFPDLKRPHPQRNPLTMPSINLGQQIFFCDTFKLRSLSHYLYLTLFLLLVYHFKSVYDGWEMVYAGLKHAYNYNTPNILRKLNILLKILGIQNSLVL